MQAREGHVLLGLDPGRRQDPAVSRRHHRLGRSEERGLAHARLSQDYQRGTVSRGPLEKLTDQFKLAAAPEQSTARTYAMWLSDSQGTQSTASTTV